MTMTRLTHRVRVDRCIAQEIRRLNNSFNILTLYSCCGHIIGKYEGCIVVSPYSIADMQELGYELRGTVQTTGTVKGIVEELVSHLRTNIKPDQYFKFPSFKARSVCTGGCQKAVIKSP
jgi:hypothetical protein